MDSIEELVRVAGSRAVILIEKEEDTEMARLSINGEWIMQGNYWDFHPRCHGGLTQQLAKKAFEWNGVEGLVAAIRLVLPKETDVVMIRRPYSYDTDGSHIASVTDEDLSTAQRYSGAATGL
jgi:hypothetical protein